LFLLLVVVVVVVPSIGAGGVRAGDVILFYCCINFGFSINVKEGDTMLSCLFQQNLIKIQINQFIKKLVINSSTIQLLFLSFVLTTLLTIKKIKHTIVNVCTQQQLNNGYFIQSSRSDDTYIHTSIYPILKQKHKIWFVMLFALLMKLIALFYHILLSTST
jgi:hypothetical protein